MSKIEMKKRIAKLKKELNHHRYLYHVLDKQEISDAAWDSLKHELFELEKKYPEFITPDSPTQRVGGIPLKRFTKVRHPQPMLSIEDVFNFEELQDWQDYMRDYLKKSLQTSLQVEPVRKFDYFCERKIDGVDIVLTYKKGILNIGATRGNGLIGENVTQNIKTIEAIPLRLEKPVDLVVQGEIFILKKDFKELNRQQKKKGLPIFANPRNVAAGSVRQLDPKVTAKRKLDCCVFEIITNLGQKTHQEVHQILKQLGFKTDKQTKACRNLEQVKKYYNYWVKHRPKVGFEYDGVVVVLNNIALEKALGVVGKAPRWMRAYKFPGEQATTQVKDIIIQIGRTRALTPVALFKPTQIMGTTVSRATLHNQDEIKRLDVRINDTVIIEKAGDVIPAVVRVLKNLRTGKEKKFKMPKKCPICNGQIIQRPGEVAHYCSNKNCFAAQQRKISHFVCKKGFDIEGLGTKLVTQLMNQGLIKNRADIFTLTRGDLEPLERFAEKSADNLVKAINKSKKIDLAHFIHALGIRHVGEQTALDLAKHFGQLKKIAQASLKTLVAIADIGPVVGQSIYNWFRNKNNVKLLQRLKKYGIHHSGEARLLQMRHKQGVFQDKTFVLTGVLKTLKRGRAKEKIRALGGRVSESVSRQTDFVVIGESPGSKYDKAKKLGVKIINEKQFLKMIKYDK
ncbi:NAD-dependent DNA ligase LigA [Patescibacteria group bacterium]|nr:NAD-dependent DNA ligase LigA [Patescibacteria group bacterium]